MKCYSCQIFKKEGPPLRQSPKTTLLKIFFSRNCHHPLSRIGSDRLILEVMSIYTAITVTITATAVPVMILGITVSIPIAKDENMAV